MVNRTRVAHRALGFMEKAVVCLQVSGRGRVGVKALWWDTWEEIPQWSQCAPGGGEERGEQRRRGAPAGVELWPLPASVWWGAYTTAVLLQCAIYAAGPVHGTLLEVQVLVSRQSSPGMSHKHVLFSFPELHSVHPSVDIRPADVDG